MNRLTYDQCAYAQALNQSVSPLSYLLDPVKFEHCSKCRVELGVVGGTAVSHVNANLIDVENDLRNQTRPGTRCAEYKFVPKPDNIVQGKELYKPVVHKAIDTSSMRHLKPCQMMTLPPVPHAPPMTPFRCPA